MADFKIIQLEKHDTKDVNDSHVNGELTVIWRDWDEIINVPKMVYVNSVNPKQVKGPHLHENRTTYFYCVDGKIVLIIQDKKGDFHEIEIRFSKTNFSFSIKWCWCGHSKSK